MGLNEFKYIYLTTQFIISALKKFNWAIPVGGLTRTKLVYVLNPKELRIFQRPNKIHENDLIWRLIEHIQSINISYIQEKNTKLCERDNGDFSKRKIPLFVVNGELNHLLLLQTKAFFIIFPQPSELKLYGISLHPLKYFSHKPQTMTKCDHFQHMLESVILIDHSLMFRIIAITETLLHTDELVWCAVFLNFNQTQCD